MTFLQFQHLKVNYGKIKVLDGLSFSVDQGEAVALFGHNGAGKSTLLKTCFGLVPAAEGTISLRGTEVQNDSSAKRLEAGIAYVPQGAGVFRDLTVSENIKESARNAARAVGEPWRYVCDLFPQLAQLGSRRAGLLSGGERRLVAISMALVRQPELIMLDEPSANLSPQACDYTFSRLRELQASLGFTLLVTEQNILTALRWLDRALILRAGRITFDEPTADLRSRGQLAIAEAL